MIKDLLQNKTAKEKANIKGREIAKIDFRGQYTSTQYGVRIEIQSIKAIEGGVEIMARAWRGGKQLGFGKDGTVDIERFNIYNPPILVDDPNGTIIRKWTDNLSGELKQRKLREDPQEAVRQSLAHTISIVGKQNTQIIKGKVGNTTSTFHPAAGANSPVDGFTDANTNGTYDSAREHAGTGSSATVATGEFTAGRGTSTGGFVVRGFFLFDTSSIGAGATIDSATFSLVFNSRDSTSSPTFALTEGTPASDSNLQNNDFSLGITLNNPTEFITRVAYTSFTVNAVTYNDMALNASGLNNISVTGNSKFVTRDGAHDINDANVNTLNTTRMSGFYADEAGTNKDPKLVVEHSGVVSAVTTIPTLLTLSVG